MPTMMMKRGRKARPLTWSQAIDLFETHLRAVRASPRTIDSYLREIRLFFEHSIERRNEPQPGEITLADLRTYMGGLLTGEAARSGRPFSASTAHRIVTTFAGFFGFLFEEGRIKADPTLRLEHPKVPKRPPGNVLSVKEIKGLLTAFDRTTPLGLRDRALVELLYATGLRRAEALALDLTDLNHKERQLTVQHGKGDKGRVVPITRSAWNELQGYVERARPVLMTYRGGEFEPAIFLSATGKRLERTALCDCLIVAARKAGIEQRVTPHTLRRTMATHLLQAGTNLRHIQILLGHADLNTTAVYLRLNTKELARELLLKHPREKIDV